MAAISARQDRRMRPSSVTPGEHLLGTSLIAGRAEGDLLSSDQALSFMLGVDPMTGLVIDAHHPLHGHNVSGKIMAIPSGRGSSSGSSVIFEMLFAGTAPAALIFEHDELILTLGVVIAQEFTGRSIPIIRLESKEFSRLLRTTGRARVDDGTVVVNAAPADDVNAERTTIHETPPSVSAAQVALSLSDRQMLAGEFGEAARIAMRVVIRAAQLEGTSELVDVEMAHIDGVFYQGPGSLHFARALLALSARTRIPASMNALSIDRRRWREQKVPQTVGQKSEELADAYVQMGVAPTYTCAPYCLVPRPRLGQQIAWAESNAAVYANAVLGARTRKYPDYLDILIAVTGRAPRAGTHVSQGRKPTVVIDVAPVTNHDDAFFATLGHCVGQIATNDIPVVTGLEAAAVTTDDLKTFGAAFATTSASPMFHMVGVTPEAPTLENALESAAAPRLVLIDRSMLLQTWSELNTARTRRVDLLAIGNPHASLTELRDLADLTDGRRKADGVHVIVTCGRDVLHEAESLGYVERIQQFGGTFLTDTCWCFMQRPVVPSTVETVVTNSGKYAHYGPGILGQGFHLRSLTACVDAACTGEVDDALPPWLTDQPLGTSPQSDPRRP